MIRRRFIIGAVLLALTGPVSAQAQGQAIVNRVVADLRQQGYTSFDVRRTLLGRIRIEADGRGKEREIVLNPHTGEILRDILSNEADDIFGGGDDGDHESDGSSSTESSSGTSGSSSDSSDDNDDNDNEDEQDDRDEDDRDEDEDQDEDEDDEEDDDDD